MSEPRIIPYVPELLPEIVALWRESDYAKSIEHRTALFRWLTERNPALRGRPPYWCLHDGTRVIGYHGHMPVIFDVDGRELLGHMAQDDLLGPSCRGKGLGQVLLRGVHERATDFAAAMWFNEGNHRSYGKGGWIDVPGFRRWVRFLDSGRLAAELSNPALRALVRVVGPFALRTMDIPGRLGAGGFALAPIDDFGGEFDALWERTKATLGIAVRRDAAYLRWRFVERPFHTYRRLAARRPDGSLAGYVVWRTVSENGRLVLRVLDALAAPDAPGALAALLLAVVADGRRENATHVVCAASHPPFVALLRRLGFLPNRREEYHMIDHWQERFAREDVTKIDRWHLMLSDADGDVWTDAD